jgi:hypothetical protein
MHMVQREDESVEEMIWGNNLLPLVLEALGGVYGEPNGIRLHFEYRCYATATIMHDFDSDQIRQLPIWGTGAVADALGAPKGLQALTLDIRKDNFVICYCRYAPIKASLVELVSSLASPVETNEL